MNARKSHLEIALEKYKKNKYAFEPRNKENLRAVENFEQLKISNSLKRACKEKQEELDECVKNEKEVDVEK